MPLALEMRICVIGNSHAAALKAALPHWSDRADHDISFFASRGQTIRRLRLEGGVLVPKGGRLAENLQFTSGGMDRIDPTHYDCLVLSGLGLSLRYELLGPSVFSSGFVRAYCRHHWRLSVSLELLRLLRTVTSASILVCPEPYLSEGAGRIRRTLATSALSARALADTTGLLKDDLQGKASLVLQSACTVVDDIFTSQQFSEGSTRLTVRPDDTGTEHGRRDVAHMNEQYGLLVWQSIGAAMPAWGHQPDSADGQSRPAAATAPAATP